MEITGINSNTSKATEYSVVNDKDKQDDKVKKLNTDTNEVRTASTFWKKDILMQALDKLENNIQTDNIHPLDNASSQPIESFDEALIELSFTKSPVFKEHLLETQANISAESVIGLFTEE